MREWFSNLFGENWLEAIQTWLDTYLLLTANYIQLLIILSAFILARLIAKPLRLYLKDIQRESKYAKNIRPLFSAINRVSLQIIWILLVWLGCSTLTAMGKPNTILVTATSLLMAWIIINLISSVVHNDFWRKTIATIAWSIAALNILGLLEPTLQSLDNMAFTVGAFRLSVLGVIKALTTLVILLWLAAFISRIADRQISYSGAFTPSVAVLLSKTVNITVITLALIVALTSIGIDLTALAVFSGAIGVGIGFGLQKIVSNLVCGVILLLDKSIKPGDVIALPEYYGSVNSLGARYVSVITRDGAEHLIPNEELITQRVENWSHSHNNFRLRLPVGVHYKSDVHKAIALCLEATETTDRVLKDPVPVCHLRGFGDNSVDLEIRFWINDPMNGRANVMSAILLKIWDKFLEHNIEIPYPQRDLHLRTPADLLPIKLVTDELS